MLGFPCIKLFGMEALDVLKSLLVWIKPLLMVLMWSACHGIQASHRKAITGTYRKSLILCHWEGHTCHNSCRKYRTTSWKFIKWDAMGLNSYSRYHGSIAWGNSNYEQWAKNYWRVNVRWCNRARKFTTSVQ